MKSGTQHNSGSRVPIGPRPCRTVAEEGRLFVEQAAAQRACSVVLERVTRLADLLEQSVRLPPQPRLQAAVAQQRDAPGHERGRRAHTPRGLVWVERERQALVRRLDGRRLRTRAQ